MPLEVCGGMAVAEQKMPKKTHEDSAREACVGAIASLADWAINYPLMTLKTCKQEGQDLRAELKKFKGTVAKTMRLYSGSCPILAAYVPQVGLTFAVDAAIKPSLSRVFPDYQVPVASSFLAGSFVGAAYYTPLESVSVVRQLNPSPITIWETMCHMYRAGGFLAFYRAAPICVATEGIFGMTALSAKWAIPLWCSEDTSQFQKIAVCGSVGTIGAIVTQPLDVIKTKVMSGFGRHSIHHILRDLAIASDGKLWRGLARGFWARTLVYTSTAVVIASVSDVLEDRG